MVLYLATFLISICLAHIADLMPRKSAIVWLVCSVIVLFLSLVAGIRDYSIGTDIRFYALDYFSESKKIDSIHKFLSYQDLHLRSYGYLLANIIASKFSSKPWAGLFLTELIILSPLYYVAVKLRQKGVLKLSVFTTVYLFVFYNFSLNIMRQSCAVSFIIVGLYFFVERKWFAFILFYFLAYHFHSTSIVFIIIPLLYWHINSIFFNPKILWVCIILATFMAYNFFSFLLNNFINAELISEYYIINYGENGIESTTERLTTTSIVLFFMWSYMVLISFNKHILSNIENHFWAFNCAFYIAFSVFALIFQALSRFNYAFYVVCIFYASLVLGRKRTPFLLKIVVYLIICFSWYYTNVRNGFGETVPYHSSILGI